MQKILVQNTWKYAKNRFLKVKIALFELENSLIELRDGELKDRDLQILKK